MKRETFKTIKEQLEPFIKVVESTSIAFDSSLHITLRVIISNICFDPKGTYQYNHEDHIKKLNNYIKALQEIKSYFKENHVVQWITDEVLMTIEGNKMLEHDKILEDDKDTNEILKDHILDGEEFYDLMQSYRHALVNNQGEVVEAFRNVKEFIKNNLF